MDEKQFIEEHIKICSRKRRKKNNGYGSRGLASGKRSCARGLWKYCQKLGIEPVLHHADLPKNEASEAAHKTPPDTLRENKETGS
jgi:hypothetical protein